MKSLTSLLLTIILFTSVSFSQSNILFIDFNNSVLSDQGTNGGRIYNQLDSSQTSVLRIDSIPSYIDTILYDQVWIFGNMGPAAPTNINPIVNYMEAGGAVYIQSEISTPVDVIALFIDSIINLTCDTGGTILHFNEKWQFFEYEPVPNPACSSWFGYGNATRIFEGVPLANVFLSGTGTCGNFVVPGDVIGVRFGPTDMYTKRGTLISIGDLNLFMVAGTCTTLPGWNTLNNLALIDYIAASLISMPTVPGDTIEAGNNTTICIGDSTILTASNGGGSYQWSTGDTTASLTVSPSITTTYYVTDTSGFCPATDSVVVTVTSLTVYAGADDSICNGDVTVLTATGGGAYLWNTGDTTASISVSPSVDATYYVTATDSFCTSIDSVQVTVGQPPSAVAISGPNLLCLDSSITLTAQGTGPYLWSTGSTLGSITVSPTVTTEYWVQTTNNCGTSGDTVTVVVNLPPVLQISADTSITLGETVTLTVSGADTYLWLTGSTLSSIDESPQQTTTYTVTGTDSTGCTTNAMVTVTVTVPTAILPFVYLPNVFYTSSDNLENNRLFVFGQGIKSLELTIYDRWGKKVYETSDSSNKMRSDGECCAYGEGWDGTYKNTGKPLNGSVFVFLLKGEFEDGGEFNESGNITLIK